MPILSEHGHADADAAYVARVVARERPINFVRDEQSRFFEVDTAVANVKDMAQLMEHIGVLEGISHIGTVGRDCA